MNQILSTDDIVIARDLRERGYTYAEIGRVLGVNRSTVSRSINSKVREAARQRSEAYNKTEKAKQQRREYEQKRLSDPTRRKTKQTQVRDYKRLQRAAKKILKDL